ncbi:LOW QUALITY PROTEIN: transcription factor grauzone [Drosophila nasuta]|uniref:Transcription factor grauzone n=1 Tax=Drosophila albomicans TaxID=7291 RepID=A0A6P8WMU2_DROAB|nr:transcription factor grauzone [Drosophila albomicans]XP_060661422.1 LOW QUALITY PROTEIN: transcription factor grauzone [Drosophila nasuta]
MICRLCLKNINANNAVYLFETDDTLAESSLLKMIAKFLQLEIMPDDNISTNICHDCCEHLEDFNNFWQLVEQKQATLKKEFLNVDVDCVAMKWTGGIDVDVSIDELPLVAADEMDEKPLDIHNLSLLGSVLDVNVDSVEVPQISTRSAKQQQTLDYDEKPSLLLADDGSASSSPSSSSSSAASDEDDEVPLVKLQHKLKPKRKVRVTRRRKSRNLTLAQELDQLLEQSNNNNEVGAPNKVRRSKKVLPSSADTPTDTQKHELEAVLERRPKGCSRAQLSKRYEEAIASYMSADCDLCDFSAKYLSQLKTHFLEVHQQDAYLKCCNKIFNRPSKLMDHIRKHINPKLFTCSICNKSLNSQDYLATHIETVHNKVAQIGKVLKFPCAKCERTFSSERRLSNHLLKHDTDQLEHSCQICDKSFANVHRLRRHIQSIHEDLHPHVCDICGKKFKFKPSFERHLLEHQGVVAPAMECPICGVWLKNEHSLRLHRFTHDSTDTVCPHCAKTCSSRTALRAHIKYAHKLTTNLQCTYCEKSFKQQRNLEEHMAIHTGLQLYNCPHCPKECRSRSNMYVHIKQRHADEWLKAKMARSHNPQYKPHD